MRKISSLVIAALLGMITVNADRASDKVDSLPDVY